MLAINTVGDPGIHGAVMTGVQVPGVSTPRAAVVWAAVIGLARLVQRPNGMTLRKGTLSMIVAGGLLSIKAALAGRAMSVPGERPKGHVSTAPLTTGRDIVRDCIATRERRILRRDRD